MNNQKMLDVVTMIANIILPDKCDHESAVEIWLRAMQRKAREALESCEREPVGNAAALREALKTTLNALKTLSKNHSMDLPEDVRALLGEVAFNVNAALSAPPRNCDVGTAEEQDARFASWRYSKPLRSEFGLDALEWAQMPYEAEEGGAK